MDLVKNLVVEITAFLERKAKTRSELKITSQLRLIALEKKNYFPKKAGVIPKNESLQKAISSMKDRSLFKIKNCICACSSELNWKVDDDLFYANDSGIGQEYLNGNMHVELIGPKNGLFKFNDFRLGLFLLEPYVFYKDHKHEAPELYLNLTKGTRWRFEGKAWEKSKSGSIIYNEPYKVHAIKVSHTPFLAVWCWPKASLKKCLVVSERAF